MRDAQKTALLNFVRSGRGFLGVHSATDTFYTWPTISIWSRLLMVILASGRDNEVVDPSDALVAFLGKSLQVEDEITKSATSTIGITRAAALTQVRWISARPACITDLWLASRADLILRRGTRFMRL
jgi:hypothetical protein